MAKRVRWTELKHLDIDEVMMMNIGLDEVERIEAGD